MSDRILVLKGGTSGEREISLRSAAEVVKFLREDGYDVVVADPADESFDLASLVADCDAVLPILHGAGGEDGLLQKQLEKLGRPFLGSDSTACELTWNKVKFKEFAAEHGILTPNWEVVDRQEFEESGLSLGSYVLKPIEGGSSLDTLIVHNPHHQNVSGEKLDQLFAKYDHMLLEELIQGDELTVGVLGDEALPVILIVPPAGQEFDYENKYNGQTQEVVVPEHISEETQSSARALAAKLHKLCGCRHLSRSDMILAENGSLYTLETNTIPGLTTQSLFPKAAAAAGCDMAALVKRFVEMAKAA